VLAVLTPVAAIVVWGLFVAPKATVRVSKPARWAIEIVVFLGAAAALAAAGHVVLAAALAMTALANGAAVRAL
jgi:Protein of unknown function (DUF2568)